MVVKQIVKNSLFDGYMEWFHQDVFRELAIEIIQAMDDQGGNPQHHF